MSAVLTHKRKISSGLLAAGLSYEKLFNKPLAVSEDNWDFTAETGDNTGIFTGWNYLGSDGLKVDIETDEEGTAINIENTEDYSRTQIIYI